MEKGFTLIEILIVLAVLLIVLSLSVVVFYTLTRKTDLDTSRDNIVTTLNTAKNKTLASEGADQYGVYFDDSSSDTSDIPHKYILFQGSSYNPDDDSFKETHILPATVKISNLSFSETGNEVVFNRLEGGTDNHGSMTIQFVTTDEMRTIHVHPIGEVSTQTESGSGTGRITDSRHVHFDLAFGSVHWSIRYATTLKFDFTDASQVETIDMADYFNDDKTKFKWNGKFIVEGAEQEYRVHTHSLDEFSTLLGIHRKGENTEAVTIYIFDEGFYKEIVHYQADGEGILGPYGGTFEEQ